MQSVMRFQGRLSLDPAQPTNNLHFQASVNVPVNVPDWEQATERHVPESLMAAEGPASISPARPSLQAEAPISPVPAQQSPVRVTTLAPRTSSSQQPDSACIILTFEQFVNLPKEKYIFRPYLVDVLSTSGYYIQV